MHQDYTADGGLTCMWSFPSKSSKSPQKCQINEFSKAAGTGYMINTQKLLVSLCGSNEKTKMKLKKHPNIYVKITKRWGRWDDSGDKGSCCTSLATWARSSELEEEKRLHKAVFHTHLHPPCSYTHNNNTSNFSQSEYKVNQAIFSQVKQCMPVIPVVGRQSQED